MARSRNRNTPSDTRETPSFATGSTVGFGTGINPASRLLEIQDLRTELDDLFAPARTLTTAPAVSELVAPAAAPAQQIQKLKVPFQMAFSAPGETLVCIRRHTRRQVLFATRKAGRGGQRKARWSKWSFTKC